MDSPPKFSETLDFILQFLRAEGFYAAEEALVRELENRCPDGSSPSASAANDQSFEAHGDDEDDRQSRDSLDEQQSPEKLDHDVLQRAQSEREEDWQDQAGLAERHTDATSERASSIDQLHDASTYRSSLQSEKRSQEVQFQESTQEVDEYSDDNDPGYVREHIRGQDAFIAREIDLSDEDASQQGLKLYHEAQGLKSLHWDRGEQDDAEDGGSSDGNGSSYFSGEVLEHACSVPGSQVSTSERDRSQQEDDRVVTLMEPVNPKPLHSRPSFAASHPSSANSPELPEPEAAQTPSTGPLSHPLSHISSDFSSDGVGLYHEPSLGKDPVIPDARTADTASSHEPSGDEGLQAEEDRPEGGWGRGYLDPFGMLGRVFGRRNSSTTSSRAAVSEAGPSLLQDSSAKQGSAGVDAREGALRSPDADTSNIASLADGMARRPEGLKAIVASPQAAARKAAVNLEPQLQPARNDFSEAIDSDTASSCAPETPKLAPKSGDSDLAFSFPVTPPSEPPAAAEPGAVFGTWPSLKKSSRKLGSKGDLTSRASSEYAASGYSTDEGGSQAPWTQESRAKAVQLEFAQPDGSFKEPDAPKLSQIEADRGGSSASQDLAGSEPSKEIVPLPPPPPLAAKESPGALAIQPLDMSTSLPTKTTLDFNFGAAPRPGASSSPSEEALPAYKPPQGHVPEVTHRSGDLTDRSMENALGREDSTGGGAASADDYSSVTYRWDEEYLNEKYEMLSLKIIHRRRRTGFEESKDIAIQVNDLIAGRYQVTDFLGSAAFSQAVQALDIKTGGVVCLKIIKNNKDYLDQSLDEIKLLKYVNEHDLNDEHGLLQLYDFFYYKEHLFLVCELLRANLYEFQKYNRDHGQDPYFTLPRVQTIARQVLRSLDFMHSLNLIHCDLKPENILIKSYSRCEVKVIDLGSSCFTTDHLSSYVQSRSYRAPEVILGLPYSQQVDIWSLGCILAELLSGYVLFQNDSLATLLARLEGILGPVPRWMLRNGRYAHRFYTRNGAIFEQSPRTGRYELLRPKRSSLKFRVTEADDGCLDFLHSLLTIDPKARPTASEALQHPWLQHSYGQ